jgi:DNA repair protein RadA/Sms
MGLPTKPSSSTTSVNDDLLLGPVWYVSGEETPQQIASRASRLGIQEEQLYLLCETHVDSLCEQVVNVLHPASQPTFGDDSGDVDESMKSLLRPKAPSLVILDSIQTMVCNAGGSSSPGGITQVRECVALCLRLAKSTGITVVLVGHVTKSGDVAGPKTVEHMVDAVLYLEGSEQASSSTHSVRVLRASKNRFGSSDEVGLYEMTAGRLLPVTDPSSLFLANHIDDQDVEGSAICISMEGMRAVAVEVQGLVAETDSKAGYGRRTVDGISYSRLNLLLGVLQKRCGMFLSRKDVYVNVIGQLRLDRGDSNGDLAVVMALVSSLASIPVRSDTAFVGEVGLLGELRPVSSLQKRLLEARRMGFSRIVTPRDAGTPRKGFRKGPKKQGGAQSSSVNGIEWIQCDNLKDAINAGLVAPLPKRRARRQVPSTEDAESEIPGRLEDLQLDEIVDDDDDEEGSFL